MEAVKEFVSDDFTDMSLYDEPQPVTVDELRPYWEDFLTDCKASGRPIPEGMTLEIYVELWNAECEWRNEQ